MSDLEKRLAEAIKKEVNSKSEELKARNPYFVASINSLADGSLSFGKKPKLVPMELKESYSYKGTKTDGSTIEGKKDFKFNVFVATRDNKADLKTLEKAVAKYHKRNEYYYDSKNEDTLKPIAKVIIKKLEKLLLKEDAKLDSYERVNSKLTKLGEAREYDCYKLGVYTANGYNERVHTACGYYLGGLEDDLSGISVTIPKDKRVLAEENGKAIPLKALVEENNDTKEASLEVGNNEKKEVALAEVKEEADTKEETEALEVKEEAEPINELSPDGVPEIITPPAEKKTNVGAIVGIVLGIALIAVLIYFLLYK